MHWQNQEVITNGGLNTRKIQIQEQKMKSNGPQLN